MCLDEDAWHSSPAKSSAFSRWLHFQSSSGSKWRSICFDLELGLLFVQSFTWSPCIVSVWAFFEFSGFFPLSKIMQVGGMAILYCPVCKCPVCKCHCVNGALWWIGVSSGVNSPALRSVVPVIGSGSTTTLTRIMCLLKMNEGKKILLLPNIHSYTVYYFLGLNRNEPCTSCIFIFSDFIYLITLWVFLCVCLVAEHVSFLLSLSRTYLRINMSLDIFLAFHLINQI